MGPGIDPVRSNTAVPDAEVYTLPMIRLGYPAQNLSIPATTNHTLRLAGLGDAEKVRSLVWENLFAVETILRWNAAHDVALFRMGQGLIPFASHPAFPYDWEEHGDDLRWIGGLARDTGRQTLACTPPSSSNPGSPNPATVERSLAELRYAARVLDLLGVQDGVIVLHLGGAYDDRPARRPPASWRPCTRKATVLRYLALENDERIWTTAEVAETARTLGVPAIVDTLHHAMNPGRPVARGGPRPGAADLGSTWRSAEAPSL